MTIDQLVEAMRTMDIHSVELILTPERVTFLSTNSGSGQSTIASEAALEFIGESKQIIRCDIYFAEEKLKKLKKKLGE